MITQLVSAYWVGLELSVFHMYVVAVLITFKEEGNFAGGSSNQTNVHQHTKLGTVEVFAWFLEFFQLADQVWLWKKQYPCYNIYSYTCHNMQYDIFISIKL